MSEDVCFDTDREDKEGCIQWAPPERVDVPALWTLDLAGKRRTALGLDKVASAVLESGGPYPACEIFEKQNV